MALFGGDIASLHLLSWYCWVSSVFFWLKRVLDRGPEHRESKMTGLCPLIIIILISQIIIYYIINYGEPSQPKLEMKLSFKCWHQVTSFPVLIRFKIILHEIQKGRLVLSMKLLKAAILYNVLFQLNLFPLNLPF